MTIDRLDALLRRFSVSARLFHAGQLCGVQDLGQEEGFLHVVRSGALTVRHPGQPALTITSPTLLFYPRPLAHRFRMHDEAGADMVCATVQFSGGPANPVAQALPPIVAMPLASLHGLGTLLELLFSEAANPQCGRQAVIDRLFEVLVIQLIRKLMNDGAVNAGLLAGMAHPQLAKALVALHEDPARAWTLETLAGAAGMSRSAFASTFHAVVGQTPGDYTSTWRVTLAQDLLSRGQVLKHVAQDVGYGSPAALSRAFKARLGCGPRQWLAART